MIRRYLNLLPSFILAFAFATASVPAETAQAAPAATFSQRILEPSCYDYVSTVTGTVDYIATFDCEYRTPDGQVYEYQGRTSPVASAATR